MDIYFVKIDEESAEIQVFGKIDTNTAPEAEKRILSYTTRYKNIIINMADCQYISSAGIRVVKRIYVAMKASSGTLKFTNVNDMVYDVLNMTGMAKFLDIERQAS